MEQPKVASFIDENPITYAQSITKLIAKNSNPLFGYFQPGENSSQLRDENKWGFVPTPQENNNKDSIIINGNDIVSIELIYLRTDKQGKINYHVEKRIC